MEFMRHLHDHVNIIPLLAKSDSMTQEEIAKLKVTIREQINAGQIKIYDFPENRKMKEVIPLLLWDPTSYWRWMERRPGVGSTPGAWSTLKIPTTQILPS